MGIFTTLAEVTGVKQKENRTMQTRQEILQELFDKGYRYIARNEHYRDTTHKGLWAYRDFPELVDKLRGYMSSGLCMAKYRPDLFDDIKWETPLVIEEELGKETEDTSKSIVKKYLLKLFYEADFRYLARDKNGEVWMYTHKPIKKESVWDGKNINFNQDEVIEAIADDIFDNIKWSDDEPFDISQALGKEPEVNWYEVPVDTPVWVSDFPIDEGGAILLHFAGYSDKNKDYPFNTWEHGKTSYTAEDTTEWKYCRLVKQKDLNK